jgi:hypothetical protein
MVITILQLNRQEKKSNAFILAGSTVGWWTKPARENNIGILTAKLLIPEGWNDFPKFHLKDSISDIVVIIVVSNRHHRLLLLLL